MDFDMSEILASYAIFISFFFFFSHESKNIFPSDIEYASSCKHKSEADFRHRKREETHTVINSSIFELEKSTVNHCHPITTKKERSGFLSPRRSPLQAQGTEDAGPWLLKISWT